MHQTLATKPHRSPRETGVSSPTARNHLRRNTSLWTGAMRTPWLGNDSVLTGAYPISPPNRSGGRWRSLIGGPRTRSLRSDRLSGGLQESHRRYGNRTASTTWTDRPSWLIELTSRATPCPRLLSSFTPYHAHTRKRVGTSVRGWVRVKERKKRENKRESTIILVFLGSSSFTLLSPCFTFFHPGPTGLRRLPSPFTASFTAVLSPGRSAASRRCPATASILL